MSESRKSNEGHELPSTGGAQQEQTLPPPANAPPPKASLPAAAYVIVWISLSSAVILFNKWVLDTMQFKFPIFLTTWHMVFASVATQVLSKTTTLLDGRHNVKMTGKVYVRAILPIGFAFSLSLVCGNQAYLYLSVAFIQMLKATTPVAVLLATWSMGLSSVNYRVLANVSIIVVGIMLASYGEIAFNTTGVIFQVFGLTFEATRLVLVERLLSSAEYKMDPLVSLYFYAPVCSVINFFMWVFLEAHKMSMEDIARVGMITLIANAMVAFLLNVSVVFLVGKTSSLVLTLCGVLKDIILVCASILIWGTTVTALQMLGYSVALSGLVYYKLGGDKLKEQYAVIKNSGAQAWGDFGRKSPAIRKATMAGGAVFLMMLVFGGLWQQGSVPSYSSMAGSSDSVAAGEAIAGVKL